MEDTMLLDLKIKRPESRNAGNLQEGRQDKESDLHLEPPKRTSPADNLAF